MNPKDDPNRLYTSKQVQGFISDSNADMHRAVRNRTLAGGATTVLAGLAAFGQMNRANELARKQKTQDILNRQDPMLPGAPSYPETMYY